MCTNRWEYCGAEMKTCAVKTQYRNWRRQRTMTWRVHRRLPTCAGGIPAFHWLPKAGTAILNVVEDDYRSARLEGKDSLILNRDPFAKARRWRDETAPFVLPFERASCRWFKAVFDGVCLTYYESSSFQRARQSAKKCHISDESQYLLTFLAADATRRRDKTVRTCIAATNRSAPPFKAVWSACFPISSG